MTDPGERRSQNKAKWHKFEQSGRRSQGESGGREWGKTPNLGYGKKGRTHRKLSAWNRIVRYALLLRPEKWVGTRGREERRIKVRGRGGERKDTFRRRSNAQHLGGARSHRPSGGAQPNRGLGMALLLDGKHSMSRKGEGVVDKIGVSRAPNEVIIIFSCLVRKMLGGQTGGDQHIGKKREMELVHSGKEGERGKRWGKMTSGSPRS